MRYGEASMSRVGQGNAAGPWVYLSNDGIIAFTKASRQIYDYDSRVLGAMGVDTAGRIVNADGSRVGASVTLAPNGLGSNSATVRCDNGAAATLQFGYGRPYVSCVASGPAPGGLISGASPGTTTSGSGGSGSGGSTSGGSTSGGSTSGGSTSGGSTTGSGPTESVSGTLVSHGWLSNTRYYVDIRNSGNVKINCLISFTYQTANDPFGGSPTLSTGMMAVGQTARVVLYTNPEVPIGNVQFRSPACSKWPFQ